MAENANSGINSTFSDDIIKLDDDDDIFPDSSRRSSLRENRKGYDAAVRQLEKLSVANKDKFLNPEKTNNTRETRKATRKTYSERRVFLFDDKGAHFQSGRDLCDCLQKDCPGCHYPCPKCKSPKCGHECRVKRRWMYEQLEVEGTDISMRNPLKK